MQGQTECRDFCLGQRRGNLEEPPGGDVDERADAWAVADF